MEKEFVPYELAVKLKELGFDELCLCHYHYDNILRSKIVSYVEGDCLKLDKYDKSTPAPLWQQAFDWFREKYNLHSWVYQSNSNSFHFTILKDGRYARNGVNATHYQEARQACLEKLIELVEDK